MSTMTLNALPLHRCALVSGLCTTGAMRRRLLDIGLTPGTEVEALCRSGFGGMTAYRLRGTVVALRSEDAATVQIRL